MSSMLLLLFTLPCLWTISLGQEIVVDLPEGSIAGHTLTSFLGNSFYAFQELPYAAPPVGDLRFAPPQNVQPWTEVRNATRNTVQCMQGEPGYFDPTVEESEDCLYLNVYTPQLPGGNQRLPVYVYIHGGALAAGAGTFNFVNPSRLIDYGIVVVTLNYRLASLGYLTTEDGVIPGNIGFKDQRFALRWVKSHIELFGGDPNLVTIGGESAGSVSVGYHLLSQNSDGLFNGAIMQSGSPVGQIAYTTNARNTAFLLGRALDPNLDLNNSNDLLDLLRRTPIEDLLAGDQTFESLDDNAAGYILSRRWAPVIENETVVDAFQTNLMHDAFLNGNFHHVPVLMGFNSEESLAFMAQAAGYDLAGSYDSDISLIIDRRLNVPAENRTFIGQELKTFYTNSTFSDDQAALVKLSSDSAFTRCMLRQAEISSYYTSVYFYQFSYMGVLGRDPSARNYVPGAVGVQHAEDLGYLFDSPISSEANANDFLAMERLLKMWTNFIKHQNPTPGPEPLLNNTIWPTVQGSNIQYLNINQTLEIRSNPRQYDRTSYLLLQNMQQPYVTI